MDQEREVDGVDAAGLEGAVVDGGGDGVAHGVGDDSEDFGAAGDFFYAVGLRSWRAETWPDAVPVAVLGAA